MGDKLELGEMQREQFAREYLVDWNASGAIRRMGLGGTDARNLAKKYTDDPEVRGLIKRMAAERARKTKLTAEAVLEELAEEVFKPARTAMERRIKLRAISLAMKHLGLFIERHEVTGKNGGPIEIANVSEIEVARRVAFILENGARIIEHQH